MTTEDEAKTKWCPLVRISFGRVSDGSALAAVNRAQDDGISCLASACMSWRWMPSEEGENKIEGIKRYRTETGSTLKESLDYVEAHPEYLRRPASTIGFCGLAGRPVL